MKQIHIKKIVLIILLVVFISNVCFVNLSSAALFSDVKETSWYYKNLSLLKSMNIIDGFPDGTFKPNNTLTKDQFLKLLVTCINSNYNYEPSNVYWFEPYMNYAYELNILESKGTKKDYNVNISREEVSYLASRAMNIGNKETIVKLSSADKKIIAGKIKDSNTIDSKYEDGVLYLYSKDILSGFTDGTFRPKETITRAQAVTIIAKIINYRKDLENRNLLDHSLIKGYELQSEINEEKLDAEFKITQNIYGTDLSDEIGSILD